MGKMRFAILAMGIICGAFAQSSNPFSIDDGKIRFSGTIEPGVLRDYMDLTVVIEDPNDHSLKQCVFNDLWLVPHRIESKYEEGDPPSEYWARCDRSIRVKSMKVDALACTLFDMHKKPIYSVHIYPTVYKTECIEVCVIQKCKDGTETTQEKKVSYDVGFDYVFPGQPRQSSFQVCTSDR